MDYQLISDRPRLYQIHSLLSDEECTHLIERARPQIAPSFTVSPETGENIIDQARTSSSMYFKIKETEIIGAIEARITGLLNIPVSHGEGLQVLHYRVGQGYQAHFDFFDPDLKGSSRVLAVGGQRVATCIMYLCDVTAGGETHFPEIDVRIAPQKGDAILFFNTLQDGQVDRTSLHASLPVIEGEKWVATKWVRERPYQ